MAVFFLYVGLELKRETIEGPFRNVREAAAPALGALGGMVAPALIYLPLAVPAGEHSIRGWAIPTATDIAFALGVLSLLGSRVPASLRLFLLALAIIDDLGAILIIALFYTSSIAGWALGGALATFVAMLLMNRAGLTRLSLYWPLAAVMWGFMLASGVHATVAGVLAAMAVPMRAKDGRSPLISAEHALKPWVVLAIMPIFAVANAGVSLAGFGLSALADPVTLGVALGLAIGKPLGVFAATLVGSRILGVALPASPLAVLGVAWIAGIGFTMSLFIGALAFGDGDAGSDARIGVLTGSAISAACGLALLAAVLPKRSSA